MQHGGVVVDCNFDGEELLALARLDLQKGAVEPALAKLKRAIAREDCPADARLEAARTYAQLGLRAKARAQFDAYLAQRPDDLDASFQLGMLSFEDGQADVALGIWERVLQRSSLYPPALYFSAAAFVQKGQATEARQWLRRAVEVIPADNLYFKRSKELLQSLDDATTGTGSEAVQAASAEAYRTQH